VRNVVRGLVMSAGLACLLPAVALACGESLFRVGKGVAYRDYVAPLPGNLIAVVESDQDRAFADRLSAAGHQVTLVDSPEGISQLLTQGDFDLVLARFSWHSTIDQELAGSGVSYLPVVEADQANEARSLYDRSVQTGDSVKHFLVAIHKILKQQNA